MSSNFEEKTINDLCSKISSGGTPSRTKKEYYINGTVKWLKTKELFDTNIYLTEEYITQEALKNSSAKIYPANTVVMAMYGATVGKLGIMKSEMSTNQACACMVVDDKIASYKYLFYSLLQNRSRLINLANGAAQQNLNSQIIKDYKLLVPSLETQKKIANILSTLDDKIELNRKMNQTLEQMAQTLFKSWFVDFDPVKAKAKCKNEEELESAALELGISKEVLELFPNEFEESEWGMIPKGWGIKSLGSTKIIIEDGDRGKNYPSGDELMERGFCPFLNNKNIIGDFISFNQTNYISEEKFNILGKGKVNIDDLVLTTRGSIGNIAIFHQYLEHKIARINSGMVVIKHNNAFNLTYLFYLLKSPQMKAQYFAKSSGTVQKQLPIKDVKQLLLLQSTPIIQNEYSNIVTSILNKIQQNYQQNETLQKTRDTLLPKLLSGELDVSDLDIENEG